MNEALRVDVRRMGKRFEAEAVVDLRADGRIVWETITDYGGLPRFMPGIRSCRVVERRPVEGGVERLVVEQSGEFRVMLFAQSMNVLLDVEHRPMQVAIARARKFEIGFLRTRPLDEFEGRYELTPRSGPGEPPWTELRYSAVIALRVSPPAAVGELAVRHNLAAQLEAVAGEVARRAPVGRGLGR